MFGLTKREDITYGRKRTARLSALDLRKREKVNALSNPEVVKFGRRRKKEPDVYSERYRGSLQKTKSNLFGQNKKIKFF